MEPTRDRGPMRVFGDDAPPLPPPATSVLDRIRTRRAIRIGYFDDSLPFAFVNRQGALVGFDVEMGTQLGRDLDVIPEFVRIDRGALDNGLPPSVCDIVMSGAAVTTRRTLRVLMTIPYLDETIAFVVPDHLAATFSDWDSIRALPSLRVGVPRTPYYTAKLQAELPTATLVPMDRANDMFVPHDPPIDAYMLTAERGSAWTLLHPEYSVAVPKPRPFKVPLAYAIAGRDEPLADIVNTWIDLKKKDGTADELFAHWILGQQSEPRVPRWSVARNVLHWLK